MYSLEAFIGQGARNNYHLALVACYCPLVGREREKEGGGEGHGERRVGY